MTEILINDSVLKTVRKARKIGRTRLAKLTGLTERQITRLETGKGARISQTALNQISVALQVPPEVFTGEQPITDDDLLPASEVCQTGCSCCG